jgi:hypothetical protein
MLDKVTEMVIFVLCTAALSAKATEQIESLDG